MPKSSSPGKIRAWHRAYNPARAWSFTKPKNSMFGSAIVADLAAVARHRQSLTAVYRIKGIDGKINPFVRHQGRDDEIIRLNLVTEMKLLHIHRRIDHRRGAPIEAFDFRGNVIRVGKELIHPLAAP